MLRRSTSDGIFIRSKQQGTEGEDLEMHDGVQRTRKYGKLIHDIVGPTEVAKLFAGGESNIFNVDVGLHQ